MNSLTTVAQEFARSHPIDFAQILETHDPQSGSTLLSLFSRPVSAGVLTVLSPPVAAQYLTIMEIPLVVDLLTQIPPTLTATLLRRIDPSLAEQILSQMPQDQQVIFSGLLQHTRGTAGALMDPTALCLPQDILVQDAWEIFEQHPQYALYYLYVVDREQRLVGVINIKELALAKKHMPLASVMNKTIMSLSTSTDATSLSQHPAWAKLHAMPVVDAENKFLGVIRYETLREIEFGASNRDKSNLTGQIGSALGEVYWLGLSGFFEAVTSSFEKGAKKENSDHE